MSVADRIRRVLALEPGATAIAFDDQAYPWSYLSAAVEGMDRLLAGPDEGAGAAVGLIMSNRPAHVAALAASIVTGRCLVTLSPMFSDEALSDDVRNLGLHAVLGDARDLARPGVAEAAAAAGVTVIEIGSDRREPLRVVRESALARVARSRPGVALEMLSSGTTGVPKRISLSAKSLELSLTNDDAHAKSADEEVRLQTRPALVWHPIVHVSGAYFVIDALYSGRKIILLERFDARRWAELVEREGVRVAHLNPTAMRMVLEADIRPEQLASLKVVRGGTAATPPELQVAFEDRYGVPVLTTYGATEFAGAVVGWTIDDHRVFGRSRLGASGRAHPGVELRTVDALTGAELPVGETGVLEVRTAQASADPSAWVRTTDVAVIDADGFLWIKGRVDDVIVRGGFKVHPAKVVAALEEHPEVREAAVVGVADERLGELPVAAVIPRHGRDALDVEELADFVRSRLAAYEVPGRIIVVDELPMTPSMKVNRPALRALFATR
jgi:long-chain acyl-CoA synthetase